MIAYAAQIACITLLAEALFRAIPVASAGFRYAYWRLVLVAALLMPWVMGLIAPDAAPALGDAVAIALPLVRVVDVPAIAVGVSAADTSWLVRLAWLYALGVCARLLWVSAGVLRLRALRRTGAAVSEPECEEIQARLGTTAELRAVARIGQPVTFGVRRPVVLLPASLAGAPEATRRAVLTHELVHVRRRDWLWVMAEEALRAVLWFHPAIWWLTSRIRLTREEFTDHVAVLASGSRRDYMQALLAFAETSRLEPAPAFARRAHLFHRIVLLSKEPAMSSQRIVLSGAAIAVLLVTGSWYVSEAFPVDAAMPPAVLPGAEPPLMGQRSGGAAPANPITPENPIPRRVFATRIPYPLVLAGTGFQAAVDLRIVVDASGSVASVTRGAVAISDPRTPTAFDQQQAMDLFVQSAADAIRQWQYEPPARAPITFYVGVTFTPGADATALQSERGTGVFAGPSGARLATPADWERVRGRALEAQRSLETLRRETERQPAAAPADARAPLRVGSAIGAPVKTKHVDPVYPLIAQSARVQGVVILEATISEQGTVSDVRVLRSIPLLDQAAIDAVRQWEFTPTLLNGQPVPVIMTLTVMFRAEQPQ